jgi:nitrogen fixation/metabolism regulation signal transduction histidine kinase
MIPIQTLLVQLEENIGAEESLGPEWESYLTYQLRRLSNIFYTDINLYGLDGKLLASSRPEIYERGLIAPRMNREAYQQMVKNHEAYFIHKESIGKLSYLSAYIPFQNIDNSLLAYLNLPYFTRESALTHDIYRLVVTIFNIYAFLIVFSVFIAVLVTNQITRPLRLIQERLQEIGLTKKNKKIYYQSSDEIGSLVKDYNRMVEELERSADKLARSERESAWREMAKQIAHEIKNPLTPMKLSVQHLQRAWKDNSPELEELFQKVSRSLIEQIDNLSLIATAFSNFAKMPGARNEVFNLVEIARNTCRLYYNYSHIQLEFDEPRKKNVPVYADREQLARLISNLVKNGIQAIPGDREGMVRVGIETGMDEAVLHVSDNGTGIPEELHDRLFEPNFTTKSSGMGLGLAIAKNIIEGIGGKIWFETRMGEGTTFFVKLPLYREQP